MDVKKHVLSEHLSPRRKVFSWLGWGLVASLIVVTGLSLNNSFKTPTVASEFQGSYTNIAISSSSSSSFISVTDANEELQKPVETEKKIETDNAPKIAEKQEFLELEDEEVDLEDGVDIDAEGTLLDNSDEGAKHGNFGVEEEEEARIKLKAQQANGSVVPENEKISNSEGGGVIMEKTKLAEENVTTYKPVGWEFLDNVTTENNDAGNFSNNEKVVGLPVVEEKAKESNVQETMAEENKTAKSTGVDTGIIEKPDGSLKNCDLFDGRWVRDGRYKPYYPPGSCPYVDKDFNCLHNGRPDYGYIKWKWQPNRCNLPRLNATDFLERLRGKRLVFVGDSLNRNMWESMVCILRRSIKKKKRVYEISGRSDFKKKGVYAFRFEDYNCTVDFVAAPFLVKESKFKRENGVIETLRLDLMDQSTSVYHDAELIVFNTGHWWTHEKTSKGEDYYQEGNYVYPRLKALNAFQKALTTWSRWVDNNIDSSRTQVFFRGYSITHFWGGQWNSGGQCHQETEPIYNETYLTKYPSKMRAVENVLQNTKTPVIYMNISRLTDYRKDAHPSIYRREYKTEEETKAAVKVQDCSHWCLPGVPDTWNELFYASLLKAGKGVWKN